MELQWQREVIEKWLSTPGVPLDARTGLLAMLEEVKEGMPRLESAGCYLTDTQTGNCGE